MFQSIGGPAVLMFAGALISAFGAIWAANQQSNSEKILRAKSDEIASLNKQIANSITGGDSFAYITPTFMKDTSPYLTLVHEGEHSLYDLGVRIVDLDIFEKMIAEGYTYEDMQKNETHLDIGNLSSKQARMLGPIKIGDSGAKLNLFFAARNGFFTESLRIQKVSGEWKVAIKVENTPTSDEVKVLYERTDEGFPLNQEGEVEW